MLLKFCPEKWGFHGKRARWNESGKSTACSLAQCWKTKRMAGCWEPASRNYSARYHPLRPLAFLTLSHCPA